MGSDIHAFIEIKDSGVWLPAISEEIDRDYTVFALMAGVRNGEELTPISPPKGWPMDVTYPAQSESAYWGVDCFAHSWLSLNELRTLRMRLRAMGEHNRDIETIVAWAEIFAECDDVRLVFFFTN